MVESRLERAYANTEKNFLVPKLRFLATSGYIFLIRIFSEIIFIALGQLTVTGAFMVDLKNSLAEPVLTPWPFLDWSIFLF